MNNYQLLINGNWFYLILFILISGGIALFSYYRTVPPISNTKRNFLILLRTLAIALLLFALFKPILSKVNSKILEPKLAILIDNSKSMTVKDASINRSEQLEDLLNKLELDRIDNVVYSFNETLTYVDDLDSIVYNGELTNIENSINSLKQQIIEENFQAALIISDGAFNNGSNPIYSAESFGKPIFTIGIGDSSSPKDLLVDNMITNEIAYINNILPVNVNLSFSNIEPQKTKAILFDNQTPVDTLEFEIENAIGAQSLLFDFKPQEAGTRNIRVVLENLEGEISYINNSSSTFVKVLDNKKIISIFAGAPSPDLSFLKKELLKNEGVEINEYVQKNKSQFYIEPNSEKIQESDLIIMTDFPNQYTPDNVMGIINKNLQEETPLFFMAGYNTDYNKLKNIESYLPFRISSFAQKEFGVNQKLSSISLNSPIYRISGKEKDLEMWNSLPPVFRTEVFVSLNPEAEMLAKTSVNDIELNEPFLVASNFQNRKVLALMAYGLYRWKMMDYASNLSLGSDPEYDIYSIFVNNAVKWLSVNEDKNPVQIKSIKDNYSEGDKVEIVAEVYDASYVPLDDAAVTVKVNKGTESRDLILNSIGNGRYLGSIEGLSTGEYYFNGEAILNNNKLGDDDGRFNIGESPIEFRNLRMQAGLLNSISERTAGKFYLPDNIKTLIDDIKSHNGFQAKTITTKDDLTLWDSVWLLVIAILLFSIEWFIRKRAGLI